jgi:DNA-binding PadR family transcriptional regulator
MEEAGWIGAESVVTEHKRRAREYQVTRAGRKHAAAETDRWNSLATGVSRVLRLA